MASINNIDITSLLWQEGSAPSTPASTKWRLYFKTTGLFLKDDAGAETGPLSSAASPLPSGTSFPGGPSNNDVYYRTDLDILFFYDGTRWLSITLYSLFLPSTRALLPLSATNILDVAVPFAGLYDLWLEDYYLSFYVSGGTALGASHKWVLVLANTSGSTIQTINVDSGASNAWRNSGATAIDALLGTSQFALTVTATKTGTPGSLYALPTVLYRIVGA